MDEPTCPGCHELAQRVAALEAQNAEFSRKLHDALRAGKRQAAPAATRAATGTLNKYNSVEPIERSQVASLAKQMNHRLVAPISAGFKTNLECEKCRGRKFMFAGRRMPILCRSCGAARYEKLFSEFECLVRDA